MDEEFRAYLEAMEARLTTRIGDGISALEGRLMARISESTSMLEGRLMARISESTSMLEGRLMARLNNSEERILNRLASMEADASNTKGFLLNDAAIASRRWLDLEARVTKLEDRT